MGFRSLQHLRDRRSTYTGGAAARYVPPSGFGYPLDGLRPSIPCRFCFTPAALMGFTLRSFLLPKGIRRDYRPDGPTYRSARRCSRRRSYRPAQTGRGSWVLTLSRVPAGWRVISPPTAGCSLGFVPSRARRRRPGPDFHPDSSHTLRRHSDCSPYPPASQSLDQPPTRLSCL
jgi:hypothetical protein